MDVVLKFFYLPKIPVLTYYQLNHFGDFWGLLLSAFFKKFVSLVHQNPVTNRSKIWKLPLSFLSVKAHSNLNQ